ncbi:polysaccharide pyruvyl transferase family protein, partial [Pseudomonas nicosulfuronedens]
YNINSEKIHHCHPQPLTPSDLKSHISEADIVIAHRLHANIIAYSLGIPSIGLNWDSKVKSFFTAVQRLDYYLDDLAPTAENIIELVEGALKLKPEFLHETLNKKIDEEISSHLKRN